jgi:hypothetical protein
LGVRSYRYEAGLTEHVQVLRCLWLAQAKVIGDVTNGLSARPEQFDDSQPVWFSESY